MGCGLRIGLLAVGCKYNIEEGTAGKQEEKNKNKYGQLTTLCPVVAAARQSNATCVCCTLFTIIFWGHSEMQKWIKWATQPIFRLHFLILLPIDHGIAGQCLIKRGLPVALAWDKKRRFAAAVELKSIILLQTGRVRLKNNNNNIVDDDSEYLYVQDVGFFTKLKHQHQQPHHRLKMTTAFTC